MDSEYIEDSVHSNGLLISATHAVYDVRLQLVFFLQHQPPVHMLKSIVTKCRKKARESTRTDNVALTFTAYQLILDIMHFENTPILPLSFQRYHSRESKARLKVYSSQVEKRLGVYFRSYEMGLQTWHRKLMMARYVSDYMIQGLGAMEQLYLVNLVDFEVTCLGTYTLCFRMYTRSKFQRHMKLQILFNLSAVPERPLIGAYADWSYLTCDELAFHDLLKNETRFWAPEGRIHFHGNVVAYSVLQERSRDTEDRTQFVFDRDAIVFQSSIVLRFLCLYLPAAFREMRLSLVRTQAQEDLCAVCKARVTAFTLKRVLPCLFQCTHRMKLKFGKSRVFSCYPKLFFST